MSYNRDWDFKERERLKKKEAGIHPVWRGVGCLLIVGLSAGGYFFAEWLLKANETYKWIVLTSAMMQPSFAPWLPSGLLLKLVVAFMFFIFSSTIVNILYAVLFPKKKEDYDIGPIRKQPSRRSNRRR